jgi:hypothetical protein
MKRIASDEVVKEGAVKKADVGANAMEQLVKEWAEGNEDDTKDWLAVLGKQKIRRLQSLKDLCTNEKGWEVVWSRINDEEPMLATKLKLWKESQPGSPVEGMQIDQDGKTILLAFLFSLHGF